MKLRAKMNEAIGFGSIDQPIMKPPNFPMKLKVFLRRQFGGRLHADRLRLFRKFLFQEFQSHRELQNLTPEARGAAAIAMRDKLITDLSRDGIFDPNWYFRTNERISEWRKSNRHQQRSNASKNRWLKESRKKLLAVLQKRISDISQREKCSLASKKGKKVTGSHRKK